MSTLLVQESRLYIARAYYYLGVGSELEQYGVPQLNATEAVTIFWDAAQGYDLTTVQEMAYSYLAVAYYEGRGVPRNYTTAFELADVASQTTEAHTVTAMIVLGNIYRRGLGGVEVDPQKAFGYFDAAAKYAAPLALLSMADMLYTKEVSRNVVQVETTDLDEMRTNTLISTSADDRVIALETALQILEQYYYPSEIQVMTWPSDIGNLVAHTWMKINKEREAQYHEQTPMNPYVIIAVSLGCLGVVVLCLLAGQYYITQRQKQRNLAKEIEVDAKKRGVKWITDRSLAYKLIGEWISSQGARNNAHIDQDSFAMLDLIGSGNFSDVYKAVTFIGSSAVICSVKVMKTQDPGAQFEFEREVELLSSLFHPNVVLVFGRCEGNVELGSIMVMEYMDYGSLHEELKWAASVARSDTTGSLSPYTDAEFLWFVHQACLGLEHLAENGIVHRDIAARNTLLGSFDKDLSAFRTLNMHDVKIADLGLSRRLDTAMTYQHQHARAMPMRTMAPESLSRNNPEHTEKSDVYMFGCFVWEVYSLGKLPYAHLVASENMQGYMLREKLSGMFLLQPETMPDAVYDICMDCWDPDPSERPTFRRLQVMLRDLFSEFRSVSVSDFASMNVRQDASNSGSDLSSKPSGFKSRLGKLGMGLGLGAVERSGNLVGGVKSKWKEWNTTGQSSSTLSAHSSLGLESSLSTSSNLAILGNDLTSKAEISPTDNMIYCGMRSAGSSEYSNSMLTSTLDMTEGGGAGMESTELSNNKDSQALHPQLPPATPKAIAQSQPQVQPPPARGMSAATTSRYAADTLTRLRKASYSSTQTHTPPPPRKASLLSHIFAAGSVVRAPHTQTRSSTGSALKFTVCNKALTAGTTSALNGRTVSSVVPETPSDASYDQLHAVYDDGKERRYTMLNTPTQIADEKEAQRRHTVTEGSGHSGLACEGDSASSADTLQSAHTSELTGTNSGMHTGMRAVVDSGREPGTRADGKATHYAGDEMMVKSTGYDGCVGSMNSTGDCADVTNTYAPVHSSRDSCPWHSEREPNAFGLKRADQSMEIYSNTSDESTTDFSSRTGNKGRRWQIVANANVANVANVDKMNIQGRKYRHNTPSTTNSSGELEVGEGQRQHVSRTNSDRGYAKDTEDAKANYSNSGSGLHFIGRQGSRRGSVDAKENIEGCGYRWHDAIRSLMGSYQGH